jgi:hypothetical protein
MIPIPSGGRVWLATGHTDMRQGFDGLALHVQQTQRRDPHAGHLYVFRGRRGSLIKVLWHDGQGDVPVCQAVRARSLHLAVVGGWGGDDYAGAAGIFAGGDRLADAAAHVTADGGRLMRRDDSHR